MPVRAELRRELRRLQHETGLATVLVTHDPEEAAFLSDEVIVLAEGRALQAGPSRQVFTRPASPEVARLLGVANLNHATVVAANLIDSSGARIGVEATGLAPGTPVLWSVRPEQVSVSAAPHGAPASPASLAGVVADIADVGTAVDHFVELAPGLEIQVRTPDPRGLVVGQACRVDVAPGAITLWPSELDARLEP